MKNLNTVLLLMIATTMPAALSVGCGQVLPKNINYAPANSMVPASSPSSANKIAANFTCPGTPNALPNLDETVTGNDYFSVCTSKTAGNFSDLLITGKSSASNSLCVVPVQMQSTTQFAPKLDAKGYPIYSCSAPTADGVPVSLPSANSFNAVIIVEAPYLNSLLTCLEENFADCPNYSFGKIR